MLCDKCKTDIYIIEDYSNGCNVCTECGLIASECIVSDQAFFDKSIDRMSHSVSKPSKFTGIRNSLHYETQDKHEMKLIIFNKKFHIIFDSLNLHESVGTNAKFMYNEIEKNNNLKGKNEEIVICALIYMSAINNKYAIDIPTLFVEEAEEEIRKMVKFIEEKIGIKEIFEEPVEELRFFDEELRTYICKFCKFANISNEMTYDIIKMIPKTEYIMRKKKIVAIALIVYTKNNDKILLKKLSKEYHVSDLAVKSAIRDIENN
jgi:transcription initiation factor TFIIIB Brf1 subunit/transcription initiation factor TFIIB